MANALIALGANLGERRHTLSAAFVQLARLPGTLLLKRSQLHATRPIGGPVGQGEFLNAAALLSTSLSPAELMGGLHKIEAAANRQRIERWQARTLDLDLLLYDEQVIDGPNAQGLVVPHPRMSFRRFVLEQAVDVAPGMVHPPSGWTIAGLLFHLQQSDNRVAVGSENEEAARPLIDVLSRTFPETEAALYQRHDRRAKLVIWLGELPSEHATRQAVLAGPTTLLPLPTSDEDEQTVKREAFAALEAAM